MLITICEDEPLVAEQLQRMIEDMFPALRVQLVTCRAELEAAEQAAIYLFDIELEQDNGLALAKDIRSAQPNAQIVFVTAHAQYVFEAFDAEPLHYLVKPVEQKKLQSVLQRAIDKCEEPVRTFTVTIGTETNVFDEAALYFAEAHGRKVSLHFADEVVTYYGQLSQLEQQLQGAFFRSHRSYIVNFAHMKRYDHTTITFTNGKVAYVSRHRYKAFVQAFCQRGVR
ncbi:LytR/AlgR family response regulator transcription factor [Caryophanon latum]|uniref:DNA-binding response regulator n=1 Tax=Caryophanon latum TaxID=33977 RepID=A0A1C0YU99_9BACL|nr:LytTR family DNA-binding domain-containing protein [Caryophanon latum]OCS90704.1 hypothetical protein A6K76_01235 [Caryophanon latum]